MIEIYKNDQFKNSNEQQKNNYKKFIMSIKNQVFDSELTGKEAFTGDGSCLIGLCNEYRVSINSKFPCPFDTRIDKNSKVISFKNDYFEFQEKISLAKSPVFNQKEKEIKQGYACQEHCFMSEYFYDVEGRITEYGEKHLRNRLKNFVTKA